MTQTREHPAFSSASNQTTPAFAPSDWLGELDVWLLAEGRHLRPWQKLGAHPWTWQGQHGAVFAVWAPRATAVHVRCDANDWQAQALELHTGCGIWVGFVPNAVIGQWYKFDVTGCDGQVVEKTDPYARKTELPPGNAAQICDIKSPTPNASAPHAPHAPRQSSSAMVIYEVHAGSWRRTGAEHATWDELATHLVPYVRDMGFTHIELMPVAEHPFYGSWGYQPTGLYAPTARHGGPEGFKRLVDAIHAAGLKLIIDWVPAHFPSDTHALAKFDGAALYEYADPREGVHQDWQTLIYDWSRPQVLNFLIANALFWIEHYEVDGLRVDAVASMLYRDYSRPQGEWIPNRYGGHENLEAISFLRELNDTLQTEAPHTVIIAEESTAFPKVTHPTADGGLGFTHKWNMGWMHDTLAYFSQDPLYRVHHHDKLTFSLVYAHSERYVLPLSHDEVVHGKGSLLNKMAGDRWQQLANLRALYAWMYAHPGKKLLFMGSEIAPDLEWNHDQELPWHLLTQSAHQGIQHLIRDLNHQYQTQPALFSRDHEPSGFQWLEVDDAAHGVLAFARWSDKPEETVVVVAHLLPTVLHGYCLGLPDVAPSDVWQEILNTDSCHYGGSNIGNHGRVQVQRHPHHGQPCSTQLTLPPLAVLWLRPALNTDKSTDKNIK
jgi:1,4-alpha-glucan branching enzyme